MPSKRNDHLVLRCEILLQFLHHEPAVDPHRHCLRGGFGIFPHHNRQNRGNAREVSRRAPQAWFRVPGLHVQLCFRQTPRMVREALQKELRARRIIVRRFNRPKISDYLRITIGTDEQMDRVVEALKEILGA